MYFLLFSSHKNEKDYTSNEGDKYIHICASQCGIWYVGCIIVNVLIANSLVKQYCDQGSTIVNLLGVMETDFLNFHDEEHFGTGLYQVITHFHLQQGRFYVNFGFRMNFWTILKVLCQILSAMTTPDTLLQITQTIPSFGSKMSNKSKLLCYQIVGGTDERSGFRLNGDVAVIPMSSQMDSFPKLSSSPPTKDFHKMYSDWQHLAPIEVIT